MPAMRSGCLAGLLATGLISVLATSHPSRAQAPGSSFSIPAELWRTVSLRWTGPLDGAVQALARQIGYGLASVSHLGGLLPPDAPGVEVSVDALNTSVANLVQQLGTQSTGRAAVVIDPDQHELRVYHLP